MARVPLIDSPCPLRFASMPSAGHDFCGQCKRRVHNLDGLSDAQRVAFFARCSGDVCVSYSVRRSNLFAGALGLGVAAAALANSAMAAQGADPSPDANGVRTVVTGPTCDPGAKNQPLDTLLITGGTINTAAVRWVDESELAETALPVIGEVETTRWLPTPPQAE